MLHIQGSGLGWWDEARISGFRDSGILGVGAGIGRVMLAAHGRV